MIGSYRLLSRIGEGGFGEVYEAEQTEPVRRRVALKVIKAGMDSAAVVARFEAERQALAVMDHPCIAKVFDGGVTPAAMGSRPYFVMELVRGEEITAFCDKNRLSINERVGLFARVCEAVQHAHNKGVIHRDLKPSNILVAYDAEGHATPKVIDFGVAKALNQRLTERTIFTDRGQLIGTPEYMSPEQAEMSGVDIDTRTDVYSLGVVLYELLTGVLPFDPKTLRAAAFGEIQRIIREVAPARPSTRLSMARSGLDESEEASRVVDARHTDVRELTSLLRRDLDWVVMRCLEKDRERRYDTATAIGEELRRYLNGEAVLAGPPSVRYRVGKFVRRNRLAVVTGCSVGVLLVAGVMGLAVLSRWAVAERGRAESQAAEAMRAKGEEEAQREIAERTLAFLNEEVFGQLDPLSGGGASTTVKEMVDRASARIGERFSGQPELEHAVRQMLGTAYGRIGLPEAATTQLVRAEDLAIELYGERSLQRAEAMRARAMAALWAAGDVTEEHARLMRGAASISEEVLGRDDERTLRDLGDVTWIEKQLTQRPFSDLDTPTLMMIAGYRGRGETPEQVLAVIQDVNARVDALWHLGDREGALALIHEVCEPVRASRFDFVRERLPLGLAGYATGLAESGYTNVAEAVLLYAIDWGRENLEPDHTSTLTAIINMAYFAEQQGRPEESERYSLEALESSRRAYGEQHAVTLALTRRVGRALRDAGRYDAAEVYFNDALSITKAAFGEEHEHYAEALNDLGLLSHARGDPDAAVAYTRRSHEICARALGDDNDLTRVIRSNLAFLLIMSGAGDEGLALTSDIETRYARALEGASAEVKPARIQDLIRLFDELHDLDPDAGHEGSAGAWRARLAELRADDATSRDGD